MSDIKEGDQVSWKYGGGNPEGTVAEVKASDELAIETKGMQFKVNTSEDNLAVQVARDGNDVVKRESTLTKLADATENDGSEATNQEVDPDIKQNGQHSHNKSEANKEESTSAASDNADLTDDPEQLEDKMDVTLDAKKVEAREKRYREDDDSGEAQNDEQSEKENGTASKKAKLDNGLDATEKAENGHAHNEDENGVGTPVAEEQTPKKKTKGPGRPKKADAEAKHAVAAEGDGSTIARRTRSKA
ncbi:hypothetical protein BGX38DRAFT_733158 [Terfezia claveryi]|nr:hypothetical protein BGX38DRAFT_733158 [Terfezia claveryi]